VEKRNVKFPHAVDFELEMCYTVSKILPVIIVRAITESLICQVQMLIYFRSFVKLEYCFFFTRSVLSGRNRLTVGLLLTLLGVR